MARRSGCYWTRNQLQKVCPLQTRKVQFVHWNDIPCNTTLQWYADQVFQTSRRSLLQVSRFICVDLFWHHKLLNCLFSLLLHHMLREILKYIQFHNFTISLPNKTCQWQVWLRILCWWKIENLLKLVLNYCKAKHIWKSINYKTLKH